MPDRGKILFGLALFLIAVSFPFWFTLAAGQADNRPQPERPAGEKHCVESVDYMKAWHMDLLNQWRDSVVREGKRIYLPTQNWPCSDDSECSGGFCQGGRCLYEMSLTNNCHACHRSKERFCDSCHNHLEVQPYCWDCHRAPQGE